MDINAIYHYGHGYGEVVPNDSVKFPIRGFDGKVLFYKRICMELIGRL
jgi:hypothetical protein